MIAGSIQHDEKKHINLCTQYGSIQIYRVNFNGPKKTGRVFFFTIMIIIIIQSFNIIVSEMDRPSRQNIS